MTEGVKLYEVHALDPAEVRTNGANTRGKLGKKDVEDLVASIRAQGQLVPIIVRKVDDAYEVVAGHRRLEACRIIGGSVLAITIEATDAQAMAALLAENEVRTRPDPFRESDAVQGLVDLGWSQETVAAALGRTVRWVAQRANLRNLHARARAALQERDWPVAWIEEYARLSTDAQLQFLDDAKGISNRQGLDWIFERAVHTLGNAPWDLEDDTLDPKAGPCSACPKTSLSRPGLFEDEVPGNMKKARCLDAPCWERKKVAALAQGIARVRKKCPEAKTLVVEYGAGAGALPPTGEKVLRSWEVTACKEGTKGAVPVIGIGKRGTAKLMWVRPHAGPETPAKAAKKPKPTTPAAKLKAAKERLEVRRMASVVEAVAVLVEGDPPAQLNTLLGLVSAYGVDAPDGWPDATGRRKLWRLTEKTGPWSQEVWNRMRKGIRRSLTLEMAETTPSTYEAAVFVGECLGKTRAELDAAALEAVPDPKSWGRMKREASEAKGKKGRGKK